MGSENSKSDDERESKRNQTQKGGGQRLYTEDEIQRALAYQKRMFEAKQSKMQASSGIYPNLPTQNLNTVQAAVQSSSPITSNPYHYSITPSAPPEDVLFPTRKTATTTKTGSVQPIPLPRPSHASPSSAGPSHLTPSTGTSRFAASSTRSSSSTPSSAGTSSHLIPAFARPPYVIPSHVTPSSERPYVASSFAGPSHITPSPAGPSHITPSPAGPSHIIPSSAGPNKNQKRRQAPRTRSRSRTNQNSRELSGIVNCVTCNGPLGIHIYQCTNGHSSCDGCRFKMARCGNCTQLITDMRNITLESTLAEITINPEERIKCSNAKDGCCLHFKRDELQNHLKECPFNIISCPVMEFSGDCSWKGTIKQLPTHFNDAHPNHCEADVNRELHIIIMEVDYKVMHLVNMGFHKFLVHIQLDTSRNNIYMATQYLGTNFGASKWTYEWHVYNKKEPRRKFEYIDICKSNATPVSEIVNDNNCAVININYAKTFLDSGKLTYKFYLKKQFENKKNTDTTSN